MREKQMHDINEYYLLYTARNFIQLLTEIFLQLERIFNFKYIFKYTLNTLNIVCVVKLRRLIYSILTRSYFSKCMCWIHNFEVSLICKITPK